MTYTLSAPDSRSLGCRVPSTAKSGRYQITTDYLTDPSRNTVLIHSSFVPLSGTLLNYQLYVRYDPSINGNGGGGSGNGGGDSGIIDTATRHHAPVALSTRTPSPTL